MNDIHIGKMIRKTLDEQGRKITWFAEQLNCDRTNIYKILQKQHLDAELLLRISKILNFDFFSYYSKDIKDNNKM